jgi:phenylacetate-CoA ligase
MTIRTQGSIMHLSLLKDKLSLIPIYSYLNNNNEVPILDKTDISRNFPDGWLSDDVREAIRVGDAEYVTTTGTNHDRMTLIRPPFFLMKQYFNIWSKHPELSLSWKNGCMRISLTTIRATQHVTKSINPSVKDRTFAGRALYINCSNDPKDWNRSELERMIEEIVDHSPYHLDGDPFYIAYLIKKLKQHKLWDSFPKPETVVHAYEFCTRNVSEYLHQNFKAPIVNLFGSTELGFLFSSSRNIKIESYFSDLDLELIPINKKDNIFSLIVTSFRNPYMPLVRYRTGDCVETLDGSNNPSKIVRVCGREKELFKRRDGRFLAHANLDDVISKHYSNIFQYQIVVSSSGVLFRYTTFDDSPVGSTGLTSVLEDILSVSCKVEFEESIAPGGSGKYFWLKK